MSATDTSFDRATDPYRVGHGREWLSAGAGRGYVHATGHGEGGPASKRVIVGYGFWIFLLSDIVMFSAFFAAHAVLQTATAGGPSGRELFNWWSIVLQTFLLLVSSFTCGLSAVATEARSQLWTQLALLVTGLLGLGFLALEGRDFAGMVLQGLVCCRRAAWTACQRGPAVAGHDDGANLRQGLSCGHSAPHGVLQPVLARPRYHLGRPVHDRLPDWIRPMSHETNARDPGDVGPGFMDAAELTAREGIARYVIGFVLACALTAASFYVLNTSLIWGPGIPVALVVLAIAQMGVHLVFFLHITTAPDNTNNVLALAFGVLIVALVIGGSLWIMDHLNENMMPMHQMMQMQR